MNKYKVKISHVFSEILDCEAANEEEAIKLIKEKITNPERDASPFYEITFPEDKWTVITEEKFNEIMENFKKDLEEKSAASNTINS
jgi:hypothetical protein